MKPVNYASWLLAPEAPLEVATAPLPDPSSLADDEIIIKNKAVAINPVDWKIRDSAPGKNPFGIKYPAILGMDVAGEVVHLGAGVQGLKRGDRVVAMSRGTTGHAYGGFQLYVKLHSSTVARIPDRISYEAAAVLPLSVSTAAAGLFMHATLGLDLPDVPSSSSSSSSSSSARGAAKKGTLLLWGGSSSVGAGVVQLAVASGYSVVATASPANYAFVKSFGAEFVLDYHDPDIVGVLTMLLRGWIGSSGGDDGGGGGPLVGAYDAIGSETTVRQSSAVVAGVVAGLGGADGTSSSTARVASVGAAPADVGWEGVEVVRVGSSGIVSAEPAVGRRVWGEYVPAALEAGLLRPAPRETVVGTGLYYVQGALDMNKRGVSAAKVVVSL
ncbi:unnamed protein product [Discula destructiva]